MNKIVIFLMIADMIFTFGAGLYGPIYAIYVQEIGGDILDAGIAWSLFLIIMGTLEIPFGKLIDKYGKKIFLMMAYLLSSIVIFGYMFVSNITELFILQILTGIAFAMGDPAWDAWFSEIIPKKEMGFDWAVFHALSSYGQGAAAIIGGFLAQFVGFQFLFMIGGIIGIASFFIVIFIKENRLPGSIMHRHRNIRKRYMKKPTS